MAGPTRLELATSGVTGRRSNQTELRPRVVIERLIIEQYPFPSNLVQAAWLKRFDMKKNGLKTHGKWTHFSQVIQSEMLPET